MHAIAYQQSNFVKRSEIGADVTFLNAASVNAVRKFHMSFPHYKETPLQNLKSLAESYGVEAIWVKDESFRFELNAFKVLKKCLL